MPSSEVTRENIIQKVCLVRFGSARKKDRLDLREELHAFLRKSAEKIVVRQAVNGWFTDKHPARAKAYEFLLKYLKHQVVRLDLHLDQERTATYNQITTYARKKWGFSTDLSQLYTDERRVFFTDRGNVSINVGFHNTSRLRSFSELEGNYFVYHSRLTEDYKGHFTQEVMRIDHTGRFKLWYFRDGTHIEQYNGLLFLFGNVVWFFGSTNSSPDRLRVMNFKYIESKHQRYHSLLWGVMLGDLPSSHDPMSCRVVLYKIKQNVENMHRFAEENVCNFRREELSAGRGKAIQRLIDNTFSALSAHDSEMAAPQKDIHGNDIRDHFLKVNEETISRICDYVDSLDYSDNIVD